MTAQGELLEGTSRDKTLSQWFTPPTLAADVVEWAGVAHGVVPAGWNPNDKRPIRVLEPSSGNGALVRPLVAAGAEVTAIEIDLRYFGELNAYKSVRTVRDDFLALQVHSLGTFDLVVMNSPFERTKRCKLGQDVAFILHALEFAPRVVCIVRSAIQHGQRRKEALWKHVRMTRKVDLCERPEFGTGDGPGAQSDFIVAELVKRTNMQREPDLVQVERW